MMTARAEYRLSLRADNATSRLGEAALAAGCVSARRRQQIEARLALRATPAWAETEEGQADALYAPYVARQQREWEVVQRDSRVWLPATLDFTAIPGLSATPDEQRMLIHGVTWKEYVILREDDVLGILAAEK